MPVEVRELIIKTEIKTRSVDHAGEKPINLDHKDIKALKQQIIHECKRLFKNKSQRDSFNR